MLLEDFRERMKVTWFLYLKTIVAAVWSQQQETLRKRGGFYLNAGEN